MPVARIFAAFVEEAEPICSDLIARGYDVEVVFPDAVLPNPADLELRVERCSAEQAIARVEAEGSSSRCMFVTPAKGPRRELLLVEMTVGTGTDGRHPRTLPLPTLVSPTLVSRTTAELVSDLAPVLPFPLVSAERIDQPINQHEVASVRSASATPDSDLVPKVPADFVPADSVPATEAATRETKPPAAPRRESVYTFSKDSIAELNTFLATAPRMERPDTLPVRLYETMRASHGVTRARKNWEGLTLAAVAVSFLALLSLGWFAAPTLPRRPAERVSVPAQAIQQPVKVEVAGLPVAAPAPAMPAPELKQQPVKFAEPVVTQSLSTQLPRKMRSVLARRSSRRPVRTLHLADETIAEDRIIHPRSDASSRGFAGAALLVVHPAAIRSAQTAVLEQPKSVPVRPAPLKAAATQPAPIKRITDLK